METGWTIDFNTVMSILSGARVKVLDVANWSKGREAAATQVQLAAPRAVTRDAAVRHGVVHALQNVVDDAP